MLGLATAGPIIAVYPDKPLPHHMTQMSLVDKLRDQLSFGGDVCEEVINAPKGEMLF